MYSAKIPTKVYKIFFIDIWNKKLIFLHHPKCIYKPGNVISNSRASPSNSIKRSGKINRGIHVYTNKEYAEYVFENCFPYNPSIVLVELSCDMKYLLGVGKDTAVFKRVKLLEEEWNKHFAGR